MNVDFRDHKTGKVKDDLLFVRRLKDKGFIDEDIEDIITEIENICPECFDCGRGCQCWNDE
jgi:hypothetical protein